MNTKTFFILISNLLICNLLIAQNITNTLGTNGLFYIKNSSTNYFTLTQSTGQVNILNTLRLENTTSSTVGVLYMGSTRFMHIYGNNNTFLGVNSGNFTMSGTGTEASFNAGFGNYTLQNNTTGYFNSAVGYASLTANTTGFYNSAFGGDALFHSTIGSYNTANGDASLYNNVSGDKNSALGYGSLYNSTGDNNTAMGYLSGFNLTTGSNNTIIGYGANVPSNTSDNQVRIGNTSITYAGVQVSWTVTSDRRLKSNIYNSNLGLNFINKLRPVSYTRINDNKQKTEYGFIAQEVDSILKDEKIENPGMIAIDDDGTFNMRYNDLIAPMVKSIQELNEKNEKLESENNELKSEIEKLKTVQDKVNTLEKIVNDIKQRESKEIKFSGK